jgi:hypothetical protein
MNVSSNLTHALRDKQETYSAVHDLIATHRGVVSVSRGSWVGQLLVHVQVLWSC